MLVSHTQIYRAPGLRLSWIGAAIRRRRRWRPVAAAGRIGCRGASPAGAATIGRRIRRGGWIVNSACNLGNEPAEAGARLEVVCVSRLLRWRLVPTLG